MTAAFEALPVTGATAAVDDRVAGTRVSFPMPVQAGAARPLA